jgi:hypothetical protein
MKGGSKRRAVTVVLCLLLTLAACLGSTSTASGGAPPPPNLGIQDPSILQELLQQGLDLGLLVDDPVVTDVNPNGGLTTGGTEVVITGTEFTGATKVTFGGTEATTFNVVNDTQITATAPAHAVGTIQVQVRTPAGLSPDTSADDFTYVAAPPTTAAPTTAPPTTAAPTTAPTAAAPVTTVMVTTTIAPVEEDGGGISGGWIAFIAVIAVIALAALSTMVYMLGKRNSKGGPTA